MDFAKLTREYKIKFRGDSLKRCFLGILPSWEFNLLKDKGIITNRGIVGKKDEKRITHCTGMDEYSAWKHANPYSLDNEDNLKSLSDSIFE